MASSSRNMTESGEGGGFQRMTELLRRMKRGDRSAAAEFLVDNASRIRRRFRGKLGSDIRRIFDSQDLLSTVSRRLDVIIKKQALAATSVGELWALIGSLAVHSIAEHTDKALRHREFGWSSDAIESRQAALVEVKSGTGIVDDSVTGSLELYSDLLDSSEDKTILRLRAVGRTHLEIAAQLGTNAATVRKRWQRIRTALRSKRAWGNEPE